MDMDSSSSPRFASLIRPGAPCCLVACFCWSSEGEAWCGCLAACSLVLDRRPPSDAGAKSKRDGGTSSGACCAGPAEILLPCGSVFLALVPGELYRGAHMGICICIRCTIHRSKTAAVVATSFPRELRQGTVSVGSPDPGKPGEPGKPAAAAPGSCLGRRPLSCSMSTCLKCSGAIAVPPINQVRKSTPSVRRSSPDWSRAATRPNWTCGHSVGGGGRRHRTACDRES